MDHNNKSLVAKLERAETANRIKSEFLGIVSHQLRTPLAGILGMANMLNLECLLPAQHEQVNDIVRAGEYLLSVIDDLSDITQIETGQIQLKLAPLDFRQLLEETAAMMNFQTRLKNIELLVNYDMDAPHLIISDVRALRQIVLNLINNALKITKHGFILINVHCIEQADTRATLVLSIEHSGSHISADKLQEFVDFFAENDTAHKRRYSNIGLGLTLTKVYTQLMNGKIELHNQQNKNTIFSCTIPFKLQTQASTVSPWETYRNSVKILIACDTLRGDILAEHIASPHTKVVKMQNVLKNLQTAEQQHQSFDIIILEQPENYQQAAELVAAIQKQLTSPPLILVFTHDSKAKDLGKSVNSAAVLTAKPAQPTELLVTLKNIWQKWLVEHQNIARPSPIEPIPVLLIEDDPIVQKVHRLMLEKSGYRVDTAEDSSSTLALLNNTYDVILLDIGLPGMSGLELTKKIRQHVQHKHTPIVALTGHAQQEDKENFLAAGINAVAIKPITPDQLQQVLQRFTKH